MVEKARQYVANHEEGDVETDSFKDEDDDGEEDDASDTLLEEYYYSCWTKSLKKSNSFYGKESQRSLQSELEKAQSVEQTVQQAQMFFPIFIYFKTIHKRQL